MKPQNYSIIGAGGLGHELAAYIIETRCVATSSITFWDKVPEPNIEIDGVNFGGNVEEISSQENVQIFIAVGNCTARQRIFDKLSGRGCQLATFIHPLAYVSDFARIADGCIVGPHCSVGFRAKVNVNNLINTGASIGHNARLGNHTICSPNSIVSGSAIVGDEVLIGSGGVVNPSVRIGHKCKIAAGSVVYRNVPDDRFVIGNPGKFSK